MRLRSFVLIALVLALAGTPLVAQTQSAPPAAGAQPGPTPEMFWQALLEGNREFVKGNLEYPNLKKERETLVGGQYPPISILSCSDSRVPPELVFNQSIGALFVVRSAGNIVDELGLASLEYAASKNWTMLLVVLAHEDCGAVKDSMGPGDPESPYILALAQRIRGSFYGIEWDPKNKEAVKKATLANARASAASLIARSAILRKAVASGALRLVVAYYALESGEVTKVD
jgi:carbonic anhydrase